MASIPTFQDNGWQFLNDGLSYAKQGKIDDAIDALFRAATTYERSQEFRLIPTVWETIGELLQRVDQEATETEATLSPRPEPPLDFRVISESTWREHVADRSKRLAWVYQWAAEHKERGSDPDTAQKLYFKAASYWEQTDEVKSKRPHQAARMYYRAILNHIRFFGTASESEPKEGRAIIGPFRIRAKGHSGRHTGDLDLAKTRMHELFCRLADELDQPAKAYKQLAMAYSSLKSALLDAGNVIEARDMEKQELWAARQYHWVAGHPLKWLYYRLRTGGFIVFLWAWILAILFGFPWIFQQCGLEAAGKQADFLDAMTYSAENALILGHRVFEATEGPSHLFSIVETAFSYFALGTALWYVTKKIE